jgi:hypothetical protein
MSTMEIPADVYRNILAQTYVRYMDRGYSKGFALQRATELMESAFTVTEAAHQTERQWDDHAPESNRWSDETKLKAQT